MRHVPSPRPRGRSEEEADSEPALLTLPRAVSPFLSGVAVLNEEKLGGCRIYSSPRRDCSVVQRLTASGAAPLTASR